GMRWGLLGVTWSYCIASWLFWYPCWSIPGKLAGLTFSRMLFPLIPASVCAIAMGFVTWLVGLVLKTTQPNWIVLAVQVFVGATLYSCLVLGLRVKSGKEALALVTEQLGFAKV